MNVSDLTNRLGVAEEAVEKDHALVENLREQAEDGNTRCGSMEKDRDEKLRRNRNNPEVVALVKQI